jgi:hypothetical protein
VFERSEKLNSASRSSQEKRALRRFRLREQKSGAGLFASAASVCIQAKAFQPHRLTAQRGARGGAMKAKMISPNELSLELKYCERCGGLWLRPVGGEQVYCVACGRAMAELPPAACEIRNSRQPRGSQLTIDAVEFDAREEGTDMDAAGGVA